MSSPGAFPEGLKARAFVLGDGEAVVRLIAACELHDAGTVDTELNDILSEWARPSFDLATDTVGLSDASGSLIARAEVRYGTRAYACVHPEHRGIGVGTWLVAWTEDHARSHGAQRIGQTISDTAGEAIQLLESRGYRPLWTSWVLQIELTDMPPAPTLPDGYLIRDFGGAADARHVAAVIDRAFLEWTEREPEPFSDWTARTVSRPGFEPWHLPVLTTDEGEVIGAAFLVGTEDSSGGWVEQLAVAREHRGFGLGQALLEESFGRFHARGQPTCLVGTDSRTGALDLYKRVGMKVARSYVHRALTLTDADSSSASSG